MSTPTNVPNNNTADIPSPTIRTKLTQIPSHTDSQPKAISTPPPLSAHSPTALSSTSLVHPEPTEDLLALFKKIAAPETPTANTSTKIALTLAQKETLEKNRWEAIRRHIVRLKREYNELERNQKSSRTGLNCSPKNQERDFFFVGKYYCACLACRKFSLRGQSPTSRTKIECKFRETAICMSFGNYI